MKLTMTEGARSKRVEEKLRKSVDEAWKAAAEALKVAIEAFKAAEVATQALKAAEEAKAKVREAARFLVDLRSGMGTFNQELCIYTFRFIKNTVGVLKGKSVVKILRPEQSKRALPIYVSSRRDPGSKVKKQRQRLE